MPLKFSSLQKHLRITCDDKFIMTQFTRVTAFLTVKLSQINTKSLSVTAQTLSKMVKYLIALLLILSRKVLGQDKNFATHLYALVGTDTSSLISVVRETPPIIVLLTPSKSKWPKAGSSISCINITSLGMIWLEGGLWGSFQQRGECRWW